MYLEIVSPEAILFSSEVKSITVPGTNGEFQMLNNHAPIVSVLKKGIISFEADTLANNAMVNKQITTADNITFTLPIHSGTLESNNNKVIILAD